MLWECFSLTQSSFLQCFPILYLLTHYINGSPLYPRVDSRITADLPIASCFCLIPIHFLRHVVPNSTCATTSSKSNSNWCTSLDLTDLNRCNSRVVEGQPESTLKWAGFDIDHAGLKIYHPAPLPGGWWKGKGRTVTTRWGTKLNLVPQHLLKPWTTWNLAPWD